MNEITDKCPQDKHVTLISSMRATSGPGNCLPFRSICVLVNGVRVTRSLFLWAMFCRSLFVLLYFSFRHCVYVLLRFTDSYYSFGIFKLFLVHKYIQHIERKITSIKGVYILVYMCKLAHTFPIPHLKYVHLCTKKNIINFEYKRFNNTKIHVD